MCGAHRQDTLDIINARLANPEKLPVRLVSTQVVEAGVDLDFPIVYRALAPLDRIVQAAGRCNRNGNEERGKVVVFQTESGKAPKGVYQKGIEKARTILEVTPDINRALNGQDVLKEYFTKLYADVDADKRAIQPERESLNFVSVAEKYRLIVEDTVTIIVPYGGYKKPLEHWKRFPSRKSWRALQPYVVSIYPNEAKKLLSAGMLDEVVPLDDHSDDQGEVSSKRSSLTEDTEDKVYLFNRADKYDAITGLPIDRDPADLILVDEPVY
jgi:CRISPR-associated endonuclease/helicase Cas3